MTGGMLQSALVAALTADPDAKTRTAAAAALGLAGAYSLQHAKAALEAGIQPSLRAEDFSLCLIPCTSKVDGRLGRRLCRAKSAMLLCLKCRQQCPPPPSFTQQPFILPAACYATCQQAVKQAWHCIEQLGGGDAIQAEQSRAEHSHPLCMQLCSIHTVKPLSLAGALPALLAPAGSTDADPELALQCRATLKALVPMMTDPAELDALLRWCALPYAPCPSDSNTA